MSALSGMTGFGRATGEFAQGSWAWEVKSVNGRGLDIRINTPNGFEALQAVAKDKTSKLFNRGSVQLSLRIELSETASNVTVNEAALAGLIKVHLAQNHGAEPSGEALATLRSLVSH